jgi:hypothetical protein
MDSRFTITFNDDHVRIYTDAEKNLEYATALWTEVSKVCGEHDCYDVLAVSNAPAPMPTMDGFEHADLFRKLHIDEKYRIAFAELNDKARDATRFTETVLFNRGLSSGNIAVFATEKDAKKWLLSSLGNTSN